METTAGRSPWLTMWTRPRATMRETLDTDPERMVVVLAILGAFSQSLDKAALRNVGDIFSVPVIILVAAVAGAIGGPIWLYAMGGLVRWTGAGSGGKPPPCTCGRPSPGRVFPSSGGCSSRFRSWRWAEEGFSRAGGPTSTRIPGRRSR